MINGRAGRLVVATAAFAVVASLVSFPIVAGRPAEGDPPRPGLEERPDREERAFFQATLGGNGRTCATCHRPEGEFALSPQIARRVFEQDPGDPLFRALDSDDGGGRDYTSLLDRALVRITVPLAPGVRLVDDPLRRTIEVRRGVPSIVNTALTAPYQQDGRSATLVEQARSAILDHFEPAREPDLPTLHAIARFESGIFHPARLRVLLPGFSDPAPPGFSTAVESFVVRQGLEAFGRHCARCHGGETGQVPGAQGARISNVFVSEANRHGLPLLRLAFRNADGSETVVETPDPGRAAITGRLGDLNAFDTPQLRGIKHTSPYFHDNSAATLGEVIDHYNRFGVTQVGARERDSLIAFLESL